MQTLRGISHSSTSRRRGSTGGSAALASSCSSNRCSAADNTMASDKVEVCAECNLLSNHPSDFGTSTKVRKTKLDSDPDYKSKSDERSPEPQPNLAKSQPTKRKYPQPTKWIRRALQMQTVLRRSLLPTSLNKN